MTDINRRAVTDQTKGTRGRLLALLREGERTVDDLAARLGLTDNAVRFHLDALERAGTVEKGSLRRSGGAGQPAVLYSLSDSGEEAFSRAYAPLLIAFLEELRERMTTAQGASELLNGLGGITTVEKKGNRYQIVGRACPLSRAVEADHCVCAAVTSLVAEVVGENVTERCDRSGHPRCCFEISSDHRARTTAHG